MKASSFKKGKTFYVDNVKLLPMARFLPAPSISKAGKGKGDGKGKGKKGKDKGKGMKASSFKKGKTFYVDNMKLLPMARFLPAPSISKAGKGKGDGKGKGKGKGKG